MQKNHPNNDSSATHLGKIILQEYMAYNIVGTAPHLIGIHHGNFSWHSRHWRRQLWPFVSCSLLLWTSVGCGQCGLCKTWKNNFKGSTKPTLACYWVHDGSAQCKVGFLPHHLVAHAANYDGTILQVTEALLEDDTNTWKAEKVKSNRGYCFAKLIGTASETMEFRSQAVHFVHPATNRAARKKKKN